MEPRLPVPSPSPEMGAHNPQELPPRPEFAALPSAEQTPERPAQQELQPAGPAQNGPVLPPPAPQSSPQPSTVPTTPMLKPLTSGSNPPVASDDDVIEKEWVDKAKKVIAETKDDPYKQEQEVHKLQADYLKKRYGKEVKISSD